MRKRLQFIEREHLPLRGDYETLTIYYRLFIPEMFPEYRRAIYLDVDTIIQRDPRELLDYPLENYLFAAHQDHVAQKYPETIRYVHNYLGLKLKHYFNSGVLLMNLAQLRDEHFTQQFTNLLNTYHLPFCAPDQDYLNILCYQRILTLPATWNALPPIRPEDTLVHDPAIIHYCFFDKPWHYQNIAYDQYFWNAASQTTLMNELLQEQRSFSSDNHQHEEIALHQLLAHADRLANTLPSVKSLNLIS
ncbi:glycosyltransferase family 8 protein [Lactobacillus sp. 3B(2020)]|uniref:glycosyltransferase family 8 protein n=1 Tax=Lactobacillus sp. 3B(2020) TaxID=2695882 RepID=UPI0015E00A83|nr:glycosyltransferase family 8 protein [Lactobacillus sp. 3B(2020)]QLL70909.1 glycosyltransferase family 8 protein [Lactobacillus sp. 3B(2020)]